MQQRHYHSKELRAGRCSEAGRIYHVRSSSAQKRPLFHDFKAARLLIHCLEEQQRHGFAQTLAFVVMPDHLHWLLQLRGQRELGQVIGTVKSLSARRIGSRIWQPGFYDRALRSEDDLHGIARYIVANPVRAGLVARVGEYPHWDCVWL